MLLPFLVIEDCSTHERVTYTGIEIALGGGGPFFVIPLVVAVLFIVRPVAATSGEGLRGFFAGLAGLSVLGAPLFRMFDHPEPRVGIVLAVGSWAALWVACLARGLRPPFGWRPAILASVPGLVGAAVQLGEGAPVDALGPLGATVVLVTPLLPTFAALQGRDRRWMWGALGGLNALAASGAVESGPAYAVVLGCAAAVGLGLALRPSSAS